MSFRGNVERGAARTLGFLEHLVIFIAAIAVVVWFNLEVMPNFGANNKFFLLTGDWGSLAIVLIEVLAIGFVMRYLVVLTFRYQFRRGKKR